MAVNVSNNDIQNMSQDWGKDASNGLPYSGRAVQKFIKETFGSKMGYFHYDTSSNRYLCFASEETKDEYLANPTLSELVLGSFDAPFNYEASISLLSPSYNAVFLGSTGNYLDFTFDIKNKNGNSTGENVNVTYTFIRNATKKVVTESRRFGEPVRLNIDDYLLEGTNTIIIGIQGKTSFAATTASVTYEVVNLTLSDSTDVSRVYSIYDDNLKMEVPFTISGSGTKIVEWYLNGTLLDFDKNTDEVVDVSTRRVKYIDISSLPAGVNNLEFRAYALIGGVRFYTKTLHRDIIVIDPSSNSKTTVIALAYDKVNLEDAGITVEQYSPYTFGYALYNPKSVTYTDLKIYLDDVLQSALNVESRKLESYTLVPNVTGEKVLKIQADGYEYTLPLNISKTSLNLKEESSSLVMDFTAKGKSNNSSDKDTWSGNGYSATLEGFKFNQTSGWIDGKLLIAKDNSILFDIAPLASSHLTTGKTLEFEYSSSCVSNDDAVLCDLRNDNGVGILITASKASIHSLGGVNLSVRYKPEEQLRISFVINPSANVTNKGLVFICVNGIVSAAANFSESDNFISDKLLSFDGTSDSEVLLKHVRIYDAALSQDKILNNYILYRDNLSEMLSAYDKNDVLDANSSFSIDKLQGQLPVMIVTGNVQELENTTNKDTQIQVDIEYINLQDTKKSFTMKNAAMRPQGTSSMLYPKKNFRIYTQKLEKTEVYDSDGAIISDKLYSFKDGAQPVNCWCLKADYAESSGTHNTGIARLWNDVLFNSTVNGEHVFRTQAQKAALQNGYKYDVRTTIDGFPILLFYRRDKDSTPIFIGKYNFNNDKSTESVFGFTDIPGFDNSRMQCWEILNNGDALALFTNVSDFDSRWSEAFESRYPDTKTPNTADLKSFSQWINSMNGKPNDFAVQKWEHMNVYMMAAYYVYLMRFGAVDQVVKNAMLTSEDGVHFYFINYDNDTINGLRNNGVLVFDPTIDRQSLDPETGGLAYAYAGHDSVLWNMLEGDSEFMQIVKDVDNALYTNGLSYDRVVEVFNKEQADKWNERIYNQDAQYKYIGPYTDSSVNNLEMLQGKRQSHRNWWLLRRFALYDSKFVSGDFKGKALEFKVINNTAGGWSFEIEAGMDMDYGFGVYNPLETGIHLTKGETHSFTVAENITLNIGDPVRIYSAVNLQGVNLSNILPRLSNIELNNVWNESSGTRLKKLILGNGSSQNTVLSGVSSIAKAKRLEELDIRGCKGIKTINLSENKYLKKLRATNSGLTSFSLAEGAPIDTLELPSSIQAITLNQLQDLSRLYIDNGGVNVHSIDISGCVGLTSSHDFFTTWLLSKTTVDSSCKLHLSGIEWRNVTPTVLQNYINFKKNGGDLNLRGAIYLTEATQEIANGIIEVFGENVFKPSNELYINAPDSVFLTGPSSILEGESAKFFATVFSSSEGSIKYDIASGSRNGVKIDADTGLLTTVENGAATSTITVRATWMPIGDVVTRVTSDISIVKRTYPSNVTILGDGSVSSEYQKYTWATSTSGVNGEYYVEWSLSGDILNHVRIESYNDSECVLYTHTTSTDPVDGKLSLTIKKKVDNSVVLTSTKTLSAVDENIILTATSNPEVMAIAFAQGWAANEAYMTKNEALWVTNEQVNSAFKNKRNIKSFNEFRHFKSVTVLDGTFYNCSGLLSLTLPESIVEIRTPFGYCSALKSIEFPEGLKKISGFAVYGCESIESIHIPKNVSSIYYSEGCFCGCTSLKSITVDPENTVYDSRENCNAIIQTAKNTLIEGCNTSFIPYGVEIIGEYAFYNRKITSITIPETVIRITQRAFSGCTMLAAITIPESVKDIWYEAFQNCTSLASAAVLGSVSFGSRVFYNCLGLMRVEIPNVTYIGDSCFGNCNFESIVIPASVTGIGNYAFQSCDDLKSITVMSASAPRVSSSTFGSSNSNYTGRKTYNTGENILYVPQGATGYDASYWLDPLQNAEKCGFTISYTL